MSTVLKPKLPILSSPGIILSENLPCSCCFDGCCNYSVILNSVKLINPHQIVCLSTVCVAFSSRQDSCHISGLLSLCWSPMFSICKGFINGELVTSQGPGSLLAQQGLILEGCLAAPPHCCEGPFFPLPSLALSIHPSLQGLSSWALEPDCLCLNLSSSWWPWGSHFVSPQPLFPHL